MKSRSSLGPWLLCILERATPQLCLVSFLTPVRSIAGRLEETHRVQLAAHERQCAAEVDARAETARKSLGEELEATRAKHALEIDNLERDLLGTKALLAKAARQAEVARNAAALQKQDLESALARLRQTVFEERTLVRQVQETTRKAQSAEAMNSHEHCKAELAQMLSELQAERKHVAEVESLLKRARNGEVLQTLSHTVLGPKSEGSDVSNADIIMLREKLQIILKENQELRRNERKLAFSEAVSRGSSSKACGGKETKEPASREENTELCKLKEALEEAHRRLSEVQQSRARAEKVACTEHNIPNSILVRMLTQLELTDSWRAVVDRRSTDV